MFRDDDDEGNTSEERLIRGLVRQILDKVLVNNQELNKVKATIRDSRSINPVSFDLNVPHSNHLGAQLVDKNPPPSHPPPHPYSKEPIITTHELPAPEGCRSFATKECHKIPIVVPRKVTDNCLKSQLINRKSVFENDKEALWALKSDKTCSQEPCS